MKLVLGVAPKPSRSHAAISSMSAKAANNALLLAGGGARAAYQVGVLRSVVRAFPDLRFSILTGVSAGAINVALLANDPAPLATAVQRLAAHWESLTVEQVFRSDFRGLGANAARWIFRLVCGGAHLLPSTRGMVDTAPLKRFLHRVLDTPDGGLHGIGENIRSGRLSAVGITTTRYPTGESVTWVEGGGEVVPWRLPGRSGTTTGLTVDHILGSCALPLVFPAAKLANGWHGDGGIRLTAPLSPAVQLGADRILAISTSLEPGSSEADRPIEDYPPPATVMGVLLDSIFLDMLDCDAMELRRLNRLIAGYPKSRELGLRPVEVMLIRPSQDIGMLATEFEADLPRTLRHLIRGLGSRDTNRSDVIATLLFQPPYIRRLIEIGERDGEHRAGEIAAFLARDPTSSLTQQPGLAA
jgi:NTE family protein